jgi:hypothetical protein
MGLLNVSHPPRGAGSTASASASTSSERTVSEAGEVPATNVRATVMEHAVGAANASRQKMVPRVMATPVLGRVTVRGDAATGPRNLVSAAPVAALYAKAEVADTLKAIVPAHTRHQNRPNRQ